MDAFHSPGTGPATQRALPFRRPWPGVGLLSARRRSRPRAHAHTTRHTRQLLHSADREHRPTPCVEADHKCERAGRPPSAWTGAVAAHRWTCELRRQPLRRGSVRLVDASGASPPRDLFNRIHPLSHGAGSIYRPPQARVLCGPAPMRSRIAIVRPRKAIRASPTSLEGRSIAPRRAWSGGLFADRGGRISPAGNLDPIQKNDARAGRLY